MRRRSLLRWGLSLAALRAMTATALAGSTGVGAAVGGGAVIVLDPGHGGVDPGAIGPHGTREKEVTLDIARALGEALAADRRTRVELTRYDDRFLSIGERVEIARQAEADLFVSIHADSAPSRAARGLSAYTLSTKASDDFADALARRENHADALAGVDLARTKPEVRDILVDLALRHTRQAALVARRDVVSGAGRDLALLENPMRSADFGVLKAPDVPSLLIETGFLSNHDDERLLRDPDARQRIGQVLARELGGVLARAPFT